MAKSVDYWTLAKYKAALKSAQAAGTVADQEAAQDASPFADQRELFRELTNLRKRWERHFASMARKLAVDVVEAAYKSNKSAWQSRVRREGFDIPMQLTAAQRTIMDVKVQDNVALIKSIPSQYFTKIEGDVSRGFLAGRDLESIAAELRKAEVSTVKRAALIARDQSNKLTAQMNSARQRELSIRYAYWKHSNVKEIARPNHLKASREGWIYDTQVGIDFGDSFGFVLPGAAISCFPADTEINAAYGAKHFWRRRYCGKLARIVTESGVAISATPNHPVLTARGWVAAGSLNLGDYLVDASAQLVHGREPDVEQGVPSIEQLFRTAASFVSPAVHAVSAAEFHGDVTDRDVDVVAFDGFLPDVFNASLCKDLAEKLFAHADAAVDALLLRPSRTLAQFLRATTNAPDSIVSRASAVLACLRTSSPSLHDVRLRLSAWLDAQLQQAALDGTAVHVVPLAEFQHAHARQVVRTDRLVGQLLEMLTCATRGWQRDLLGDEQLAQRYGVQAGQLGGVLDAVAVADELDAVVRLEGVDFDGHVYNLETEGNWYSTHNRIVHNCRCGSRSIIPAIDEDLSPDDLVAVPGFPGAFTKKPKTL